MGKILLEWIRKNSVILVNAASLIGTSAVTSGLGFVYWWVAARYFQPGPIGFASSAVSVMMLLGGISVMGMGTLLITELPRHPDQAGSLISTGLIFVGGVGACIGVLFAYVVPYIAPAFGLLRADSMSMGIFALGVSLCAITIVLDLALIGLLRGGLQLWRNTFFAIIKLVALVVLSFLVPKDAGLGIYATWVVGNILSLFFLLPAMLKKGSIGSIVPRWGVLRKIGFAGLQHHMLNLTQQAPSLLLPIVVTVILSARINAWFYISWMIVGFVFTVPTALATVLHATNAAQRSALAHKTRVTVCLSILIGLLAGGVLELATKQVLGVFGHSYIAGQALWCLRILTLAALPSIIKSHYMSICRIYDRLVPAMVAVLPGCLLELGMAIVGGHLDGLQGLSVGWVIAMYIEACFMLPTVCKVIWPKTVLQSAGQGIRAEETIYSQETLPMPAIKNALLHNRTNELWLMDTLPLPVVRSESGNMGREQHGSRQEQEHMNVNTAYQFRVKPPRLLRYDDEHFGHAALPTDELRDTSTIQ